MGIKLVQKSALQLLENAKSLCSISETFLENMPSRKNNPSFPGTCCFSISAKQWPNSNCLATLS